VFLVCVSSREGTRIVGRYETETEAASAALVERGPGLTAFYAPAGRLTRTPVTISAHAATPPPAVARWRSARDAHVAG
jgi:hypothetical protein